MAVAASVGLENTTPSTSPRRAKPRRAETRTRKREAGAEPDGPIRAYFLAALWTTSEDSDGANSTATSAAAMRFMVADSRWSVSRICSMRAKRSSTLLLSTMEVVKCSRSHSVVAVPFCTLSRTSAFAGNSYGLMVLSVFRTAAISRFSSRDMSLCSALCEQAVRPSLATLTTKEEPRASPHHVRQHFRLGLPRRAGTV